MRLGADNGVGRSGLMLVWKAPPNPRRGFVEVSEKAFCHAPLNPNGGTFGLGYTSPDPVGADVLGGCLMNITATRGGGDILHDTGVPPSNNPDY